MKTIYFVRHGESESNSKRIYSGTIDTPLTSLGKEQARKTGMLLTHHNITSVISSSLSRAFKTAEIITFIIDPNNKLDIEKTHLLQEVYFGNIQGKAYNGSSGLTYAIESGTGESARDLYKRGVQVLALLKEKLSQTDGNLLVVGHGSFSSVLFAIHEGYTENDFISYRKEWMFKNAEIKQIVM